MEDNKRILIAIILSMTVIFLYPVISARFFKKPEVKKEAVEKTAKEEPLPQMAAAERVLGEGKKSPSFAAAPEELVTVETPLYRAVFTNHGGGVKSWKLKNYRDALEKDSPPVDIVKADMVKPTDGKTPLAIRMLTNGFPDSIPFKPSKKEVSLSGDSADKLSFAWTSPDGITIEENLTFKGNSYGIEAETTIVNGSKAELSGKAAAGLVGRFVREKKKRGSYHMGPVRRIKEKVIRAGLEAKTESGNEDVNWLGLEDKYFLSAFIPKKDSRAAWESAVSSGDAENAAMVSLVFPLNLKPGQKTFLNYSAFMGPKEYDILKAQGNGLEEAIELGMFAFIAKPLRVVLKFFERYIKNYGIAIILLTLGIKVLFHPLSKYSLKSMREMQKIQPQLNALKEKYKNDREKLNKELMELYKRYKINPLGGCLPMILQIPVFIGLYEVLGVAIELRHAPFALWIHDLSAKDPYYISPVVMGATMFIQQKMTPSAMDPAQAKMMLLMPVVFTFLFMNFPSGLVLYWLTNNILSIAQQYQIYREGVHKAA